MKKLVIISLLFFCSSNIFSQGIGINTNGSIADSSAMLDVKSANKGFLPPRVFLVNRQDTVTIKKPAAGLMVYNTNQNIYGNGCCTGIFVYNGSVWTRLITDLFDTLTTAIFPPSVNAFSQNSQVVFQTFTATQTGTLLSVSILMNDNVGNAGSRPIKIYKGNGNTGTLLTILNLTGGVLGLNWETASSPTSVINIYAGLTYTIETSEKYWVAQSGNPYSGGYSNSISDPSDDYGFIIKVRN